MGHCLQFAFLEAETNNSSFMAKNDINVKDGMQLPTHSGKTRGVQEE